MHPLVMTGIVEVKTALHIPESNAMTAIVAGSLGIVGILDVADYMAFVAFY